MILDHCHRESCVQIIEALRAKVEELTHCYAIECANHKSSREQLAVPNDDSALQERLAQERERCAKVVEDLIRTKFNNECDISVTHDCAAAIRSMT